MADAIREETLIAVTDSSYFKEICPEMCSACFVLKCSQGRRRVIACFPKKSIASNAYRGELLGLLAIHIILLAVNQISPGLTGRSQVFSGCLGALRRVAELPPYRIATQCKHSDILKTILVNCCDLTFSRIYSHVNAHQDDNTA